MGYNKSLKIRVNDYLYLEKTIKDKLSNLGLTIEEANSKCIESGYSEKAVRWYLLRGCGLTSFVCDTLYKYLNDNHIDSALRAIISSNLNKESRS